MSTTPDPRTQAQVLEQERRRLSQRLDEVSRLCDAPLPPSAFYSELLQRLLDSLAAPAGCVWLLTSQGNLQQAFQINFQQAGLDSEEARASHDSLLRLAFTNGQPLHLPPRSSLAGESGQAPPGNPSNHLLLLVPIRQNDQVIGLIEVLQGANRPANAVPGFLQYMNLMAELAGRYQRNQMVGQLIGQQQLWSQLELFARTIHGSLNPTEVAYHVANEGRRLIECDRVSVILRPRGERARVEAVSGSDTVEKRSNQVVKLRRLADRVLEWGERLVFSGTRDDTLPPKVLEALDEYMQESPSRLLVLMPLTDEREGDGKDKPKQPPRSALVMECYEAPADEAQIMARLDVVARHASSALYNSLELRRIPFRWIWLSLARLQEGLGGQTRAIVMLVVAALSLLVAGLIFLPYPLKVDSTGTLQPAARRTIYSPNPGIIRRFEVYPGQILQERTALAELENLDLDAKIRALLAKLNLPTWPSVPHEKQPLLPAFH
ncbi:MAG: GAF domain-containing protein [Gemmataceae bacterium]